MNLQELYTEIAKREGNKNELNIADIKEVVGVIADLVFETTARQYSVHDILFNLGNRRAKKRDK